jgi:MFS family permease
MPEPTSASDEQQSLIGARRIDSEPDPLALSPSNDDLPTETTEDDYDSDTSYYREQRRQRRKKHAVRIIAFAVANLIALCAGSSMVFSMYAPLFQSRLHYTQLQVNGAASACSIALYIPISILGYICDRYGAQPLALTSAVLFAVGYGLAAGIYRNLDLEYNAVGKHGVKDKTYPLMVFAFVCIGAGTCAGYISSVSTVAKNFGKGKYRGLALAMPITCFGLSGMWLSQVGSRLFYEQLPDGSKGDIDVFRFFVFLAVLLFVTGVIGFFTLRVVDEDELIEEAIEELENSGLLDGGSLLGRSQNGYGGIDSATPGNEDGGSLFDPSKDDDAKWKKNWVLNAETRRFLSDHTMWPFALAFLLMIGPGEAFINNLGAVLNTLTPPETQGVSNHSRPSAATHVSIFGVTSTIARLLIGTLTDLLAPQPKTQHYQAGPARPSSPLGRITVSRVAFNLFFGLIMSTGLLFLASGAAQNHADRFWIVSGLIGAGYGAVFSLTPLIVTIIWGVENFATNFGIIATVPAIGSVFWGSIFSAVYQAGARSMQGSPDGGDDGINDDTFCYGKQCYSVTFWAEGISCLVSCGLLYWAWKGKGGWQQRGIVI